LLRLSTNARAKALADRALRGLAGFARALKVKYRDIEIAYDGKAERGLADNGDLGHDLPDLLEAAGSAAREGRTVLAMFLDELQYVEQDQLAALITALHRTSQQDLPVILIGAGLPQLRARVGLAKSYSERLFTFHDIGALSGEEAKRAITGPAGAQGVRIALKALDLIVAKTHGYPYFLQEWGKHAWDTARSSPISSADVETASVQAVAALDASFFRVRLDRLTPVEQRYLRAMAELGPGPHRSGAIARVLKRKVTSLGPIRSQLIDKGMVWSPSHGDTAFTVPLFDEFMRRIMAGGEFRRRE
jgi:hypothetical protein